MVETAPNVFGMLLGIFLVGIPAIVILWATMFAICKLLYEDFFND
jgi:hypothetical protein